MFTIEKITVSYDAEEDRLRLAVCDGQEQTLSLWLTRRMANELIGMLLGELKVSGTSPTDEYVHAALQAWEQSAANTEFKPLPPVRSESVSSGSLVRSVDVMQAGGHFGLVFQSRENRSASLTLSSTGLRQWLGIVHKLYGKAEWPCEGLWPDWMTRETQLAVTDVTRDTVH